MTKIRLSISRHIALFLLMAGVAEWMVLNLYATSLGQKRQVLTIVTDSPLITLVKNKTGLQLDSFRIVASDQPYGNMIGIPDKPYMMLSSKLNDTFTDSEKEYVVLHEVGHYLLGHSIKELIFFLLLFTLGCFIIRKYRAPLLIPFIAVLFDLTCIQYGMVSEKQADRFAVARITDPNGMITSTEKFRAAHLPPLDDYSPLWPIFYRSNPYHIRIDMARQEIQIRKN